MVLTYTEVICKWIDVKAVKISKCIQNVLKSTKFAMKYGS